jgi:hypothetical protein
MRNSKSILLFIGILFLSSCSERAAMPGRAFEGKIVQQITIDAGALASAQERNDTTFTAPSPSASSKLPIGFSANATITMNVRGDKVESEMSLMGGLMPVPVRTIIDRNARTMTMLVNKHAYVTNLRSIDAMRSKVDDSLSEHPDILDSLGKMIPKPTGMKKTINGLECEEYIGTFKGMNIDMWITQDPRLKFYDVIEDAFLGKNRTGMGGMEQMMMLLKPVSGEGKVPVTMTISKDGKTFIKSELKEMTEQKLSDDLFEVPKDYEIIKK